MSTKAREPPAFISETKTFATYKRDLKRWAKLTDLKPEQQADMVVHCLDGHSSGIKEKIDTQVEEAKLSCEEGIDNLLTFLEKVYKVDEWADSFEKYTAFEKCVRTKGQSVQEFMAIWENSYAKVKAAGCDMSDQVLAYKLLTAMDLKEMECKLVLTGVDYKTGHEKKDLLAQMTASIKKFVGHSSIQSSDLAVKEEPVFMTQSDVEKCFLAKGWKKPGGGRNRLRSNSLPSEAKNNYKGRKNALGSDFKPLKCFKCKCNHEEKCNCPCVYHFADKCPGNKKNEDSNKPDLGLFMKTNSAGLLVDHALFMMDAKKETHGEDIVLIADTLQKLSRAKGEKALIDCACPNTVAGVVWTKQFISQLSEDQKLKVEVTESQRVYKFGGGERRPSKCLVRLPCSVAGSNVKIATEVVDADLPLLIGNSSLKKAGAVLHIATSKVELLGKLIPMEETPSGHFSIIVGVPKPESNADAELCLVVQTEEMSEASLQKLHHYWGHTSVDKLTKLIQGAGKLCDQTKQRLAQIKSQCKSCQLYRNRIPPPAVSIPRATKPNEIVSVDLKEWSTGKHRYIIYFVDLFSRFLTASFIDNKQSETIGEAMLDKWISVFGPPGTLHSDRGGEFVNENLTQLCEYLNCRQTFTAAYSPNQNGCNESNHSVVDRMLQKMLLADSTLKPEVALSWAVNAKNSLTNYQGFSPSQIVFGENPRLPALYSTGPPGLEEVSMNKNMAEHINAMYLGREAFIECESDRVLKTALKKRVYARNDNIHPGDWVYFKNKSKRWEGPVKITTCSGKLLYAVRAGRLLTINTDHAVLSKSGEEVLSTKMIPETKAKETLKSPNNMKENMSRKSAVGEEEERPDFTAEVEPRSSGEIDEVRSMSEAGSDEALLDPPEQLQQHFNNFTQAGASTRKHNSNNFKLISHKDIKRRTVIRFKQNGETDWTTGRVLFRAGKATQPYRYYWNITNTDTNHTQAMNTELFEAIEQVPEEEHTENNEANEEQEDKGAEEEQENSGAEDQPEMNLEESCFAVNIPRWRHGDKRCQIAKEEELDKFDEFAVYEEVPDDKQERLGTQWVLNEKIKCGKAIVKARLTIRGDQEDTENIRKDSPTVRKGNIKILLTVAAKEQWMIKTSDVSSAFLQSVPIEREVFVLPPKERRVPGVLWRLTKTVYGLADASRGFYISLSGEIQELGCTKARLDPAMFLLEEEKEPVEELWEKKPLGLAVSHVDDVLHAGGQVFNDKIMKPLFKKFKFGSHEDTEFRYVGMNFTQTQDGSISVDQDHYLEALEGPDMSSVSRLTVNEVMDDEGQREFRSAVAKMNSVGYQSRPDICFAAKSLSTQFGKATKGDLKAAARNIIKLKSTSTKMMFPSMGELNKWVIVGHGDAGIKSMPDKITSVGGHVILLCNTETSKCCVLLWRSKKIVRKVTSSLAGETLAMVATVGEIVYTKAILRQIFGRRVEAIPTIVVTDSKNLTESVNSTSLVDDPWLRTDIAAIQEAIENGTISTVRRVSSKEMLANCLTKSGATAEGLIEVLRTGRYMIPGGWRL